MGGGLDELGRRLYEIALQIGVERKDFLDWLGDRVGADPRSLPGKTKFSAYDSHSTGELIEQLRKAARKLSVDPTGRAFRDQYSQEHSASVERLQALHRDLAGLEAEADRLVYDVYGITEADREFVEPEYRTT